MSIELALVFILFLWDLNLKFSSGKTTRTLKYQGLFWTMLYLLSGMPENAYFISYKKTIKH